MASRRSRTQRAQRIIANIPYARQSPIVPVVPERPLLCVVDSTDPEANLNNMKYLINEIKDLKAQIASKNEIPPDGGWHGKQKIVRVELNALYQERLLHGLEDFYKIRKVDCDNLINKLSETKEGFVPNSDYIPTFGIHWNRMLIVDRSDLKANFSCIIGKFEFLVLSFRFGLIDQNGASIINSQPEVQNSLNVVNEGVKSIIFQWLVSLLFKFNLDVRSTQILTEDLFKMGTQFLIDPKNLPEFMLCNNGVEKIEKHQRGHFPSIMDIREKTGFYGKIFDGLN